MGGQEDTNYLDIVNTATTEEGSKATNNTDDFKNLENISKAESKQTADTKIVFVPGYIQKDSSLDNFDEFEVVQELSKEKYGALKLQEELELQQKHAQLDEIEKYKLNVIENETRLDHMTEVLEEKETKNIEDIAEKKDEKENKLSNELLRKKEVEDLYCLEEKKETGNTSNTVEKNNRNKETESEQEILILNINPELRVNCNQMNKPNIENKTTDRNEIEIKLDTE